MLAAVEDKDVVVLVYAHAADFLERPGGWEFRPVLDRFVRVCAVPDGGHAQLPCSLPVREVATEQTVRPVEGWLRPLRMRVSNVRCYAIPQPVHACRECAIDRGLERLHQRPAADVSARFEASPGLSFRGRNPGASAPPGGARRIRGGDPRALRIRSCREPAGRGGA